MKRLAITMYLLLLIFQPGFVRADIDMQILPGFDSYQKHGRWLSLRITLSSSGDKLEGEVSVEIQQDGGNRIYSVPVTLSGDVKKVEYLYVLPESFRRSISVSLVDTYGNVVSQKDVPLMTIPPTDMLIAVVDQRSDGLGFLTGLPDKSIHVSYSTAEFLPDRWKGYDSIDAIVLGNVSLGAISASQKEALIDWICGGGTLIVSGGANSQNLIGTFLEELLPVKIEGTRILNSISSLSKQFGHSISRTPVVVALSRLANDGKAIATENDGLPIIAEKQVGAGKVVFLSFDYFMFRLKDLQTRILPSPKSDGTPKYDNIIRLLSANRSLSFPPYKFIGLFLLLYTICFGPMSYLFLRRSGRGEWTWIVMPVIAGIFILGSLGFNYATRGRSTIINELSVVDIYQNMRRARISSYFGVFSPTRSDLNLSFPESGAFFVSRMPSQGAEPYKDSHFRLVQEDIFRMEIPHIRALSSQLFYGESFVDFDGNVSANLSPNPDGTVYAKLISNLPFDLSDCYIFSEGRYARIGDLKRGIYTRINLGQTYSGNIFDEYSVEDAERSRFINAIKQSLLRNVPDGALIGWMNEPVLKTLVKKECKSSGMALVIVKLAYRLISLSAH